MCASIEKKSTDQKADFGEQISLIWNQWRTAREVRGEQFRLDEADLEALTEGCESFSSSK